MVISCDVAIGEIEAVVGADVTEQRGKKIAVRREAVLAKR
jgi:hypothetical protein